MGVKLCVVKKMLGFFRKPLTVMVCICLKPCPAWYAMPAATKHHHLGVS